MIEILHNPKPADWDGYAAHACSSVFTHLHGWGETLALTYGLPIFRLAARSRSSRANPGSILGLLPLILFAPPSTEKRLISLPYSDAAGIVADNPAVSGRLLTEALTLATELGAVHVELRQAGAWMLPTLTKELAGRFSHTAHSFKTGLRRRLPPSADALWPQLSAKVRNQVRKARGCGCQARIGGIELIDDFYAVFSENMRDLGSPVHSLALFQGMIAHSGRQARVIVVDVKSVPAAAAIVFQHHAILYNPWASSLRRHRPSCPNMLLYWTMLAHGIESGCGWFDFGRSSPNASTCRFKQQWGAEMEPLIWHVFSRRPWQWHPKNESLVDESWKALELETSRRQGPAIRRWISL